MQITLDLPEDLVGQISGLEAQLPEALALGLGELTSRPHDGFSGFSEVLEFLADLPTPQDVLALRPSESLQAQIDQLSEQNKALSEQNKAQTLTTQGMLLWKQYEYLEHVVRMAKARAYLKLQDQASAA